MAKKIRCESKNVKWYSKNQYDGGEIYRCIDCNRTFQLNYTYVNQKLECPHCKSHEMIRQSHHANRYTFKCKSCKKYFHITFADKKSNIPECPKCKKKESTISNKNKKRHCTNCGHYFYVDSHIYLDKIQRR